MNKHEIEAALSLIQEFKRRWMAMPPFADRLPRATREAMTMAHMPVMQLEQQLLAAQNAAGVSAPGDAERLDWLMRQISGAELRRLGIVTSGGMTHELLDRMMAALGVPVDHQQVTPEHPPMPGGKK